MQVYHTFSILKFAQVLYQGLYQGLYGKTHENFTFLFALDYTVPKWTCSTVHFSIQDDHIHPTTSHLSHSGAIQSRQTNAADWFKLIWDLLKLIVPRTRIDYNKSKFSCRYRIPSFEDVEMLRNPGFPEVYKKKTRPVHWLRQEFVHFVCSTLLNISLERRKHRTKGDTAHMKRSGEGRKSTLPAT